MSARDVIARLMPGTRLSEVQNQADNIISHLHASGYRILGPDEIAPVWAAMIAMVEEIHAAHDNLSSDEWVTAERICADLTKIMDARSLSPTQPEAKETEHAE